MALYKVAETDQRTLYKKKGSQILNVITLKEDKKTVVAVGNKVIEVFDNVTTKKDIEKALNGIYIDIAIKAAVCIAETQKRK